MGKKVEGRNAPHYQLYIGGDERVVGAIGLSGPVVPARLAEDTLKLLLDGYRDGRNGEESVRDWALRIGKDGIRELVKPIQGRVNAADEGLFFDFGHDWEFAPPAGRSPECAAGTLDDDLQKDLADDSLINLDRALAVGADELAGRFADAGYRAAAQRLRIRAGLPGEETDTDEQVASTLRMAYGAEADVIAALDRIDAARNGVVGASLREALAYWIDLAEEQVAKPVSFGGFDMGALGDSDSVVANLLKTGS